MAWFDARLRFTSTTQTAEDVGVHPVTLRRWLASKELQRWLSDNKKKELEFIELRNGKRVWQFGNENRTDLRKFLRERETKVREENKPQEFRLMRSEPLTAAERHQRLLIRRYSKALIDLQAQGFAPQDSRLVAVKRRRATMDETISAVTEHNRGQWWR